MKTMIHIQLKRFSNKQEVGTWKANLIQPYLLCYMIIEEKTVKTSLKLARLSNQNLRDTTMHFCIFCKKGKKSTERSSVLAVQNQMSLILIFLGVKSAVTWDILEHYSVLQ